MSATTRPLNRVITRHCAMPACIAANQRAVRQLVSRSFLAQSVLRDCASISPRCTTKEHFV